MNNEVLEKVTRYAQLGLTIDETLTWEPHIDALVNKCNKRTGILWKISQNLPRRCAENYYLQHIRSCIDYASIIYDGCSRTLKNKLEQTQRRAAVACTHAFNRTPTDALLRELGWPTLEKRREYLKLTMIYKMKNRMAPDYLLTILPASFGHYRDRPTRYPNNLLIPASRTARYSNSYIPTTCHTWNSLTEEEKRITSLDAFKYTMKKKYTSKRPRYLSDGRGRHHINQTRMRLGLSHLKQQLHAFGIIGDPSCQQCGAEYETTTHYLMNCPLHADARAIMLNGLDPVITRHNLDMGNIKQLTEIVLGGHTSFTEKENQNIFTIVQTYIEMSRRFT